MLVRPQRHAQRAGPDLTWACPGLAIAVGHGPGCHRDCCASLQPADREGEISGLEATVRAKRPDRVPLVLTRKEVESVLRELRGVPWLMASLMYGAGLRVLECARLRVKDIEFTRHELTVRDGKGRKDRVTMLPATLAAPLQRHLEQVRQQHESDLAAGAGSVALPDALTRKYPRAPWDWAWQWVFPATRLYVDPETRHTAARNARREADRSAIEEGVADVVAPERTTKRRRRRKQ